MKKILASIFILSSALIWVNVRVYSQSSGAVIFQRVWEPKERAFSILIPQGWQTEGGIFRVDPTAQGGSAQSIAAKLDFTMKKDRAGTVMMRTLPEMLYFDMRNSPAGQMGLFPPGSNYNGMTVYPVMSAIQFLSQVAFPYAHPKASGVKIVEQRQLPEIAQKFQLGEVALLQAKQSFRYDAGLLTLSYQEGGATYKEKIFCIVEDWGPMGAGMWGNRETVLIRAPEAEFAKWEPIFSIIQGSPIVNSQWLAGEIQGQIQRGQIAVQTQQEIERIDREIVKHRQKTNAEIHNDMFLNLTDQEEYVNPHTNQVEIGSNQWQNRWVAQDGTTIYSDDTNYDPNRDQILNRSDFKKTPVRPRGQ